MEAVSHSMYIVHFASYSTRVKFILLQAFPLTEFASGTNYFVLHHIFILCNIQEVLNIIPI
jgi:hypothetical protein